MTGVQQETDEITDFDWEMLAFVAQWAGYSGPDPEDVFPNFGMTCPSLRERVEDIVSKVRRRHPRINDGAHRMSPGVLTENPHL